MERMLSVMFICLALLTFGLCHWLDGEQRRIATFVATDCVVISSAPVSWEKREIGQQRQRAVTMYAPDVKYRFSVDGKEYIGEQIQPGSRSSSDRSWAQSVCDLYPVERNLTCYYNPADPAEVYLKKQPLQGRGMLWGLGFLFLILGIAIPFLEKKADSSQSGEAAGTNVHQRMKEEHEKAVKTMQKFHASPDHAGKTPPELFPVWILVVGVGAVFFIAGLMFYLILS